MIQRYILELGHLAFNIIHPHLARVDQTLASIPVALANRLLLLI